MITKEQMAYAIVCVLAAGVVLADIFIWRAA